MSRQRLMTAAVSSAIVLVLCLTRSAEAQTDHTIVIEGATLIDGTGRAPISDAKIIIAGNRIERVGVTTSVSTPAGAEIVDARGKFVIPGLFESHAHYPEWGGELFLAYGITSVIDVGNSTEWMLALKKLFASNQVKLPRLFSTGEFLGAPPNVSRGLRGDGSENPYMTYVSTVEDARSAARKVAAMGMDGLKVWQNLSPEQIRAIVDEGHRANIPVMGHAFNAEEAAELGYNRIEHTHALHNAAIKDPQKRELYAQGLAFSASLLETQYFDHIVNTLVSRNVYYDPLLIYEYKGISMHAGEFHDQARILMQNPGLEYIPAETRQAMVQMYPTARETGTGVFMGPISKASSGRLAEYKIGYAKDQEFVRRFVEAGGKVCAGTDTPGLVPGLSLHQEMQMLVEAGLAPMQAIQSATVNPATFLRKGDQLGTVEPGKLADLVILDADPLADIRNTQKISKVMLNGRFVDSTFHRDYHIPFARPRRYEGGGQGFFSVPLLTDILPRSSVPGRGVELQVVGKDFTYASEIVFSNRALPTKFINATHLAATIPADLVAEERTYFVKVRNPKPGGGESEAYGFVVFDK